MEKRYQPDLVEPELQKYWAHQGVYEFKYGEGKPIYAIDTPPPTVSGKLHLGHVYSYSHADFMARYFRMRGYDVFYPMGFDDNGLPTEHLVERKLGKSAQEMGRQAFIKACLEASVAEEKAYERLWRRLGLSIDWRYSYRTIDADSRRISQQSFIDLYQKGLLYRKNAPINWCPACQTALAQADLVDIEVQSEFVTLQFELSGGGAIPIATTRPELLPACVAVFVHPEDERFKKAVSKTAIVPLFQQEVPVLADPQVDPNKGTGAVMCCTFGDQTDINWWRSYELPLIEAIDARGKLTDAAGQFSGWTVKDAREAIKETLTEVGALVDRNATVHVIRAHDRDDVPVEFITTQQWFIRILDQKEVWLKLGASLNWYPHYMENRFISWVENLNWDWCVSRQRYYGVPIPVWYCADCGQVLLPSPERLPVDPLSETPDSPCNACGSSAYIGEQDVLDTWATSALTPQIVTRWLSDPELFNMLFPMTLRPQAHEIIRTWTFYTLVKSDIHFKRLPWRDVLISGWGIAGEGMGKISKSRGGGPMPPMKMLEKYSADAVRYWAASTSTGKDAIISEEKVVLGQKLVTKLWNLARFSQKFIYQEPVKPDWKVLSGGDRWILSLMADTIETVTNAMANYDYAFAKNTIEKLMWIFADNYLEMAKGRLYSEDLTAKVPAKFTLSTVLLNLIKLFAPFLPHVTEKIYQVLFHQLVVSRSIHLSKWPEKDEDYFDPAYLDLGGYLIAIASSIRRYKSEHGLSLGTAIEAMHLMGINPEKSGMLVEAFPDLRSVTRVHEIAIVKSFDDQFVQLPVDEGSLKIAIKMSTNQ